MMDATHDLSKNKGVMTLVTDRSTKPDGFLFTLKWDPSSSPLEVPIGMHHLGRTMTINPISVYSAIQHPQRTSVSNTTTLVTDRGPKPNGFPSPFRCVFTFLTHPTFPTRDLVVTEVPIGMHHLGMNPITITIIMITDYNPIGHP